MKNHISILLTLFFALLIINNNIFSSKKDFVSLINAFFDEKEGNIVVSWEALDNPRAIYKIYRLDKPLESKTFLFARGELIKVLDYKENTLVDTPPASGKYHYFVSVTLDDREGNQVLIDQNYTHNSVEFLRSAGIAREIKAKFIPQNSEIFLKWDPPLAGEKLKGYVLYRSSEPLISGSLARAKRVAALPDGQNSYYDKIETQGQFYYAVTTLSIHDFEGAKLVPDDNVLSKPVVIASLDTKKLPDFFIAFPLDLEFRFEPNIDWVKAPESLDIFSLEITPSYAAPRAVSDKKEAKKSEPLKKPEVLEADIKKEVEEIDRFFLTFHRQKRYYDFIQAADQKILNLKSVYAGGKLKFYQAFSFYKIRVYDKAGLIIDALKSDSRFMKYNRKKVLLLEKKIQENL